MRIPHAVLVLMTACASTWGGDATPVAERIAQRDFPSVFQAWSPATPLPGATPEEMTARHDLWFTTPDHLGLAWDAAWEGEGTTLKPASIAAVGRRLAGLRRLNPRLVVLVEVRYRDAPRTFLPADSPHWRRDASGRPVTGWAEGGFIQLHFEDAATRTLIARRARALAAVDAIDGVMLDWWDDDDGHLELAKAVRDAVGGKLIITNPNDRTCPRTAPFCNGAFMECTRNRTDREWAAIAAALRWNEAHFRPPRINCLETWFQHSRQDLALMRATTTLALTHGDGFCLFSDPNPLPTADHLHDWYGFWDKGLGRPAAAGVKRPDGAWERTFTGGVAVWNPMGNPPVTVERAPAHRSRATGMLATSHVVPAGDGDILVPERATGP